MRELGTHHFSWNLGLSGSLRVTYRGVLGLYHLCNSQICFSIQYASNFICHRDFENVPRCGGRCYAVLHMATANLSAEPSSWSPWPLAVGQRDSREIVRVTSSYSTQSKFSSIVLKLSQWTQEYDLVVSLKRGRRTIFTTSKGSNGYPRDRMAQSLRTGLALL